MSTAFASTSRGSSPFFEIAAKTNKPILLHPARIAAFTDFAAAQHSRYEIWIIFG